MESSLIALHGFTLNGAVMHSQLGELPSRVPGGVTCVDAPHTCPDDTVDRLYASWGTERFPPPYLAWWRATDDGRLYRGWEATRDALRAVLERHPRAGLLGFSQGATVAASLAALSACGDFPEIPFVILIAGRVPRAEVLAPLFEGPISVPSLHVWGERDRLAGPASNGLAERFDQTRRQITTWPGSHTVPNAGPAADAIADFIERRGR